MTPGPRVLRAGAVLNADIAPGIGATARRLERIHEASMTTGRLVPTPTRLALPRSSSACPDAIIACSLDRRSPIDIGRRTIVPDGVAATGGGGESPPPPYLQRLGAGSPCRTLTSRVDQDRAGVGARLQAVAATLRDSTGPCGELPTFALAESTQVIVDFVPPATSEIAVAVTSVSGVSMKLSDCPVEVESLRFALLPVTGQGDPEFTVSRSPRPASLRRIRIPGRIARNGRVAGGAARGI
jgi:hypothetical protein